MKHLTVLKTPLTVALLLGSSAAMADVKPADVWGEWKSQMAGFGYEITAKESLSGTDLTISDLTMRIAIPEEDGSVDVTLTGMTFQDNGDGTVSIKLPSILPIGIHVEAEGEDAVDVTVNYTTTGLAMVASGAPGDMTYTYSAASMGMALAEMMAEGTPIDVGEISLSLNNVSGSASTSGSELKTSKQNFRAENLFYTIDVTNPERSDEQVMVIGQVNGLSSSSTTSVPDNANYEDMAAVMAAGFSVDGSLSHTGSQSEFAMTSRSDNMSGNISTASGNFAFTMNSDEIAYSVSATDGQLNMVVPDLPFPVGLTMEETGFDFKLPVARTDQPQDFRLALTLGGFSVPDMIWGMFDPAGQLSHAPATVAFDVTGKVRVLADIFNPEELDDDVPGELHELTVNGLTVRAAGAELTGTGAFTFDNTDLDSFDGMPRPEGALNLALTGGNALLDTLVAMGFIPEDQANGTRMMMGMFTVPGDGPDSLASTIEVNEQGHVLANGQRLK